MRQKAQISQNCVRLHWIFATITIRFSMVLDVTFFSPISPNVIEIFQAFVRQRPPHRQDATQALIAL